MATRIRYRSAVNNTLGSRQVFRTAEGSEVLVSISLADFIVKVFKTDGSAVLYQGVGTSLSNAKIKAKNALMLMGVSFDKEARKGSLGRTLSLASPGDPSLNG